MGVAARDNRFGVSFVGYMFAKQQRVKSIKLRSGQHLKDLKIVVGPTRGAVPGACSRVTSETVSESWEWRLPESYCPAMKHPLAVFLMSVQLAVVSHAVLPPAASVAAESAARVVSISHHAEAGSGGTFDRP